MFTGLVEEIGKVTQIYSIAGGKRIKVTVKKILDDLKIDDSVSINGVCLTAKTVGGNRFHAEVSPESLSKTNLGSLAVGRVVNV